MNIGHLTTTAIRGEMRRQRITLEEMARRLHDRIPSIPADAITATLDNGSVEVNALCALCHRGLGTTVSHLLRVMEGCNRSIDEAIALNAAAYAKDLGIDLVEVLRRVTIDSQAPHLAVQKLINGQLPNLNIIRLIADELAHDETSGREFPVTFSSIIATVEAEVLVHNICQLP